MALDYRSSLPPSDPYYREFAAIQQSANREQPRMAMTYLAVAPSKPQDGLYLSAAGVLGTSRGLYRYDSSTATYTFIA